MSEAALRFDRISKRFGDTTALDAVRLEVRPGEFFGLVGVNGAGKTTLIKCLLDFCSVDGGAIDIFGRPHGETASRSRLAFLPERFNPPYYLTGRDFLRYMLQLYGRPYEAAAIAEVFDTLDLARTALDRAVRTYSKGMTQKLGLAACLLSRRDIYVLDEPTGGLDPKARARLKGALIELQRKGHTVFLTSHALADVAEMCDRMAVLHDGRLRFVGAPQALAASTGASDLEQAFLSCIAQPQ